MFWGKKIGVLLVVLICVGIVFYQHRVYRSVSLRSSTTQLTIKEQFVESTTRDAIPSIDRPVFEGVANADTYLHDFGYGIDVDLYGAHRFYPFQILVWHEIVNDTFGGKALAVTYDPLCFSGRVFERTLGQGNVNFGVSEWVWNNSLVMFDRETNSLWSSLTGKEITQSGFGRELVAYPSRVMTWSQWKSKYPRGIVLSRSTGHERDYTINPYGSYDTNDDLYFPLSTIDARLNAKEKVWGVVKDGQAMAFRYDSQKEIPDSVFPVIWACWSSVYPDTSLSE